MLGNFKYGLIFGGHQKIYDIKGDMRITLTKNSF